MARRRHTKSTSFKVVPLRRASYRTIEPTPSISSPSVPPLSNSLKRPSRPSGRRRPILLKQTPELCKTSLSRDEVKLTLPLPPSINHQYATVNGRRILSVQGRHFKELVAQEILLALTKAVDRRRVLQAFHSAYLTLSICFHFASPLRRDVDGGLKITQDALCEALGINDNKILQIHLVKALDLSCPRMEVSLTHLTLHGLQAFRGSPLKPS